MKKSIYFFCLFVLVTSGLSSYAQQNKQVSDTVVVSNEWTRLNNDIKGLDAKLIIAKNNLTTYLSQAGQVHAQNPAASPVNQAPKGRTGSTVPAPENTKKDYESASQAANQRLNSLHDQIFILASEISKKKQQLAQLNASNVL
ncbi:MAG: hypothetical protein INR73_11420 [Williamsia sp.]|nr:hypothetical protein [Williamsia sp.]